MMYLKKILLAIVVAVMGYSSFIQDIPITSLVDDLEAIARDNNGSRCVGVTQKDCIHIIYYQRTTPNGPFKIYWLKYDGHRWLTPELVSSTAYPFARLPSLAIDTGGNAHSVYAQGDGMEIYYRKYNSLLSQWENEIRLSSLGYPTSDYPSIAVDTIGNILTVWQSWLGQDIWDIYYNYYDAQSQSWIGETRLTDPPAGYHTALFPAVATIGTKRFGVTWAYVRTPHLWYREIYYKEMNFETGMHSEDTRLTFFNDYAAGSYIDVDISKNIHIAFFMPPTGASEDEIYWMMKSATTGIWSDPICLSPQDNIGSFWPSLSADNFGNVYLLWDDRRTGVFTPSVYQRKYTNGIWGPEQMVIERYDDEKRPTVFCDIHGDEHIVWSDKRIEGMYNVFYKVDQLHSTTHLSLAFNNAPKLGKDLNNVLHLYYNSNNRIFYSNSNDGGISWAQKQALDYGDYPVITFDATDHPCIIWQRNVEIPPLQKGGELWFSRYDGANWSDPHCLISFVGTWGEDVSLPSFTVDPSTNIGYVAFEERDRWMNGPISRLHLGWFPINNPTDTHFVQLYHAESPVRCEFPSISLSSDYLYVAFQKEHTIYRIRRDIDTGDTTWLQVSRENRYSHHPYVDVEANRRINYVWEDSTSNNIEIHWAYEYEGRLRRLDNVSHTPGKSQWPQICKGTTYITWSEYFYPPTNNNWDILYKDLEYEDWHNLSNTLEMSKYSHGVIIWPPSSEPSLTAIWTEGDQSPYEIQARTIFVNPRPAYYYVNAGQEEPSPWTIQRAGYIQFAAEPEKTIDYHGQKLIYHFPALDPAKRYQMKLVFYFESQNPDNWKMRVNADNIFYANTWITPGEITALERWLPTACYEDGEIRLEIEKEAGDYALIAQIMIYEYEREVEGGENVQAFETFEAEEFGVSIMPNPCHSQTTIHYSAHANDQSSQVSLRMYDASGRLVKRFLDNQAPSTKKRSLRWDGTDENGRFLSSGVYFVVLESGNNRLSEKLVLVK